MPVLFTIGEQAFGFLAPAAIALPLLLGLVCLMPRWSRAACGLAPLAALPALALAFAAPVEVRIDPLMLGARFALTAISPVWLFVTAVLWISACWFSASYMRDDPRRGSYFFFMLGSMSGNLGLILAGDPVVFVTLFALMSFMSYGLVIHDRQPLSMQAGRVYLAMAVIGEMLQFAGLARLVFPMLGSGAPITFQSLEMPAAGDPAAVALLIAGFGVKAGLPGLHMWLPMAHPVAPAPASAVLSGSMIKAGLIGWMLFLPLGSFAWPAAGQVLAALGLASAYLAAAAGCIQRKPKAVLAYSSVSQMGLITCLFGLGLQYPGAWPVLQWAVVIYAAHHAFAKSLLFISAGMKSHLPSSRPARILFWTVTILAAAALAGLPLTSGMAAKSVMKAAVGKAAGNATLLIPLLTAAAAGTTLLMVRFLHLLKRTPEDGHGHELPRGAWAPWLLPAAGVAVFAWYLTAQHVPGKTGVVLDASAWIKGLWPIAAGVILYAAGVKAGSRFGGREWIPPGDVYHLLVRLWTLAARAAAGAVSPLRVAVTSALPSAGARAGQLRSRFASLLCSAEQGLAVWRIGGAVVLLSLILLFWLSRR